MATPNDKGQGQFNLGAYSNPKLDELTLKIQSETDQKKRNDMIREAFKIHQDDVGHIPLHQQALAWATSKKVEPGPAAEQLHVLQVDHAEVEVGDAARSLRRRHAAPARRDLASGRRRRARAGPLGALSRRRRLALASARSPMAIGAAVVALRLHLLRGVRRRGRAAQPVRPGDARARRLDAAAGLDGGRLGQVPARHRRAGPRRPLGADVRRAHLALRRRRVGAAVDR